MKTGPSQERTPLSGIKVRTQLRICPPKTILLGVGDEIHDVFELEFLHYPIAMGFDRSRMQFHFLGDLDGALLLRRRLHLLLGGALLGGGLLGGGLLRR